MEPVYQPPSADYTAINPQAGDQGYTAANSLLQNYAQRQAGTMLANNDPNGAASTLMRSGNIAGGEAIQDRQTAQTNAADAAASAASKENYQFIVDTANSLENVRKNLGSDKMLEAFDQLTPIFQQREGASDETIAQMRAQLAANPDNFLQMIATNAQQKIHEMHPGDVLMNDSGEYQGGVPAYHVVPPGGTMFETDPANSGNNAQIVGQGQPQEPIRPVQAPAPAPFTLSPGASRYGPDGKLIATAPVKPAAGGKLPTQDAARLKAMDTWLDGAEQLAGMSGEFTQRSHGVNTGPQWNQFGGHSSGSGGANVGGVRPGAVYDFMFNPQEYAQIQELDAISNRATPMLRPTGSGRILGPEYTNFGRAFPSSKNVPAANAEIDREYQQQLGSARAKVTFYHDWAAKNGSLDGADDAWINHQHGAVAAMPPGSRNRTWDPVKGLQ